MNDSFNNLDNLDPRVLEEKLEKDNLNLKNHIKMLQDTIKNLKKDHSMISNKSDLSPSRVSTLPANERVNHKEKEVLSEDKLLMNNLKFSFNDYTNHQYHNPTNQQYTYSNNTRVYKDFKENELKYDNIHNQHYTQNNNYDHKHLPSQSKINPVSQNVYSQEYSHEQQQTPYSKNDSQHKNDLNGYLNNQPKNNFNYQYGQHDITYDKYNNETHNKYNISSNYSNETNKQQTNDKLSDSKNDLINRTKQQLSSFLPITNKYQNNDIQNENKDSVSSSYNYTNQLRSHLKNMQISEDFEGGNNEYHENHDNNYLSEENSFDEKIKNELKDSPMAIKPSLNTKFSKKDKEETIKIKRQNSGSTKGSLSKTKMNKTVKVLNVNNNIAFNQSYTNDEEKEKLKAEVKNLKNENELLKKELQEERLRNSKIKELAEQMIGFYEENKPKTVGSNLKSTIKPKIPITPISNKSTIKTQKSKTNVKVKK